MYELELSTPAHLWISLPWGPSWLTGKNARHWTRWIKHAIQLSYRQIELGGEVHLEGPEDSAIWNIPDPVSYTHLTLPTIYSV